MRITGFNRPDRQAVADPAAGEVYLERRPGESTEEFEMRLAAAANERSVGAAPAVAQRRAYEEGRRDQHLAERPRRRRGGFGLIGLVVVIVAALGVLWMVLAAREGSFAAGGAVVDQKISQVTSPARDAANQAVDRTGKAVENAGQAIETQGQKLREKSQ